eukprot:1139197-Pelagomonas_calceolata.AAC.7
MLGSSQLPMGTGGDLHPRKGNKGKKVIDACMLAYNICLDVRESHSNGRCGGTAMQTACTQGTCRDVKRNTKEKGSGVK